MIEQLELFPSPEPPVDSQPKIWEMVPKEHQQAAIQQLARVLAQAARAVEETPR